MKINALLKKIFINFSRAFLSFFYSKEYLTGRWFDNSAKGWKWAWKSLVLQKIIGYNRNIPWPCSPFMSINKAENIIFSTDDLNNFQHFGSYFQNFLGKIYIGKGTYIAANVGIITANHDFLCLEKYNDHKDVIIGKKCWIGMNSVILPGVVLGDNTIVGAGSVVTKSYEMGNCVIGGNPAKIIKKLDHPKN